MVQVVPLRYGAIFKKAFSDPEVFTGFVGDVIGEKLHFTRIEQEKAFLPPVGRVDVRFDLFGEDVEHRAIVELQHVREADAFSRFHYYHLVAQIEQVTSSKQYDVARTVYTIVLLTRLPEDERLQFDLASQSSDIITHDGRPLGLFKHRIVFLNPRAVTANTPEPVRQWLELFEDSLDHTIDESAFPNPLMRKVIQTIEEDNLTPQERYWYKEEAIWEDTKSKSFREGEKKGLHEGLEKGLKEGHDKGLKEGHDKGKLEGKLEAIVDLCEVFGIELDASRRAYLNGLSMPALDALRARIKESRGWPEKH